VHYTLLVTGGLALAGLDQPTYKTCHNACFGYRIEYPADLRPQPNADNGDGRRFVPADEHGESRAIGKRSCT